MLLLAECLDKEVRKHPLGGKQQSLPGHMYCPKAIAKNISMVSSICNSIIAPVRLEHQSTAWLQQCTGKTSVFLVPRVTEFDKPILSNFSRRSEKKLTKRIRQHHFVEFQNVSNGVDFFFHFLFHTSFCFPILVIQVIKFDICPCDNRFCPCSIHET